MTAEERVRLHLAIILDGNRRWAREQALPVHAGHYEGLFINVMRTVWAVIARDIRYLTVYAFSTENWNRDPTEIEDLMKLFEVFATTQTPVLDAGGVRIRVMGDVERLPKSLASCLAASVAHTQANDTLDFILALNYGGRAEIVRAVNRIAANGSLPVGIDEEMLRANLDLPDVPNPDLIIRTGGEQRLSNFLLWQAAYSELVYSDKLWPAFGEADLDAALTEFRCRRRRFGR